MKIKKLITYCKTCNKIVPREQLRLYKNGAIKESICKECRKKRILIYGHHIYRTLLNKEKCSLCGFIGKNCQLDYDHIDGNHKNNKISNLRVLCANCHRLIHHPED